MGLFDFIDLKCILIHHDGRQNGLTYPENFFLKSVSFRHSGLELMLERSIFTTPELWARSRLEKVLLTADDFVVTIDRALVACSTVDNQVRHNYTQSKEISREIKLGTFLNTKRGACWVRRPRQASTLSDVLGQAVDVCWSHTSWKEGGSDAGSDGGCGREGLLFWFLLI